MLTINDYIVQKAKYILRKWAKHSEFFADFAAVVFICNYINHKKKIHNVAAITFSA